MLQRPSQLTALNPLLGLQSISKEKEAGKIKHSLVRVPFADINKHLEKLRDGDIVGRAVVTFAETAEPRREKEMVA